MLPRRNAQGNAQTTFTCAKSLCLKVTAVYNLPPKNLVGNFDRNTDTCRTLALLQAYWQFKCCFLHYRLPQTKATLTELAIMYFDPTCDSLGRCNGCGFGVVSNQLIIMIAHGYSASLHVAVV